MIAHPLFLVLKEIIIIIIIIPEIIFLLFYLTQKSQKFSVIPFYFRFFSYRIILFNLKLICGISARLRASLPIIACGEKLNIILFKILQNFFSVYFPII